MRIVKLAVVAALAGCGQVTAVSVGEEGAAITAAEVAALPRCTTVPAPAPKSRISIAPISGTGMVVAYVNGRAVCKAQRPQCAECSLNDVCPSSTVLAVAAR